MISLISKQDGLHIANEHEIDEQVASIDGFRPIMHSPPAAVAVANLLLALMTRNTLSARARELVILRIGWRTGSEYEFCNHVRVARAINMSDEEILGVREPDHCRAYSEIDRAVLKMADELIDHTEVSAQTQTMLKAAFSVCGDVLPRGASSIRSSANSRSCVRQSWAIASSSTRSITKSRG